MHLLYSLIRFLLLTVTAGSDGVVGALVFEAGVRDGVDRNCCDRISTTSAGASESLVLASFLFEAIRHLHCDDSEASSYQTLNSYSELGIAFVVLHALMMFG